MSAPLYDALAGDYDAHFAVPHRRAYDDLAWELCAGVVRPGDTVLDVGCGPGALTTELVRLLGPAEVAAVDPSESFVAAARERHPGVTVEQAAAEELPFADDEFDTVGGLVVQAFGRVPKRGETTLLDGLRFRVVRADSRRLHTLQVERAENGTPSATSS